MRITKPQNTKIIIDDKIIKSPNHGITNITKHIKTHTITKSQNNKNHRNQKITETTKPPKS